MSSQSFFPLVSLQSPWKGFFYFVKWTGPPPRNRSAHNNSSDSAVMLILFFPQKMRCCKLFKRMTDLAIWQCHQNVPRSPNRGRDHHLPLGVQLKKKEKKSTGNAFQGHHYVLLSSFFWQQLCCRENIPSFCRFYSVNSQKQNHFWRNSTFLRELQCVVWESKWIDFRPREETLCDGTECAQALFLGFLVFSWRNFFLITMQIAIQLLNPKDYKHINAKCDTLFLICIC